MDTTALRDAYRALLDAASTVADIGGTTPVQAAGEWSADQILAHVALLNAATIAAASSAACCSRAYPARIAYTRLDGAPRVEDVVRARTGSTGEF